MKTILSNILWCLVIIPWLLRAEEQGVPQFVEVTCKLEESHRPLNALDPETEVKKVYESRCIFGTNLWMIEGEFSSNAKQTWWCTGTNIIEETVMTKDSPERKPGAVGIPFIPHHVGDRFTTIHGHSESRPLEGMAQLNWLAFCSGAFLKAEGRRLQAPFRTAMRQDSFFDRTQVFKDTLSLPELIEIRRYDKNVVCYYEVKQSTNYAGWTIPTQFDFRQYRFHDEDATDLDLRVLGTVTSIRKTTEPVVPAEVMKQRADVR
jgi:hypothetical protein